VTIEYKSPPLGLGITTYHVKYTFPDGGWPVFHCSSKNLEKVVKSYLSFPGSNTAIKDLSKIKDLHIENLWRPIGNDDWTVEALTRFVHLVKNRPRHQKWVALATEDLLKRQKS
jgi:lantibiotic modifying enzyme